jgi:putative pyruvate formate lyase activating enzyme
MNEYDFLYENCKLCPRTCKVNRLAKDTGFCGSGPNVRIAAGVIHHGEEPGISGGGGSGTIFFSGCTLRCCYCQNYQISREMQGRKLSLEELAYLYLSLEEKGAVNINLVTGTHFIPSIIESLDLARNKGLTIPVVWNSSGYETEETVSLLGDWVDIFLPDIKTLSKTTSKELYNTDDYPLYAAKAIKKMAELQPSVVMEGNIIRSGVIVRHLVLPGRIPDTRDVIHWYGRELAENCFFSLMGQYTPVSSGLEGELGRPLSSEEYERAMDILFRSEIVNGYIQETEKDSDWLPDFKKKNPFPSGQSITVWSVGA